MLTFADGSTQHWDLLIGADSAHSQVWQPLHMSPKHLVLHTPMMLPAIACLITAPLTYSLASACL